jgi:hypothetical protein
MTIYNKQSNAAPYSGDDGNSVVFVDKATVTAALTTSDKVRPVLIPAGTKVNEVVIKNGDLDTGTGTLTATIGFEHADGSSGASATAIAADGANALTGPATTTYHIFPPVVLEKDAYVVITPTIGANALGASADVHCKVRGENLGAK